MPFVWLLVCTAAFVLGIAGSVVGLHPAYNRNRCMGNRLFDAGLASLFGVIFAGLVPPLGIVAGALALSWRHDGWIRATK